MIYEILCFFSSVGDAARWRKPLQQMAVACGKPLRVYDSFHNSNRIAIVDQGKPTGFPKTLLDKDFES
ncbi:hypothetical protein [Nostoc sp.]|uniref:hypothetical protein n=1 Tax=Nostoc sp. TaxID=1180 RepID=UPI002FF90523